jgi:hypothetical protein
MTKLNDDDVEALNEIENYWRERIAQEIWGASNKIDGLKTDANTIDFAMRVARTGN